MSQFSVENCVSRRGSRPHIGINSVSEDGVIPNDRCSNNNDIQNRTDMDTTQNVGYSDLETRTSYVNASLAYNAIKKVCLLIYETNMLERILRLYFKSENVYVFVMPLSS